MNIGKALQSFGTWIASWFKGDFIKTVGRLLGRLEPYSEPALRVVSAIDEELKPALKVNHLTLADTLQDFIYRQLTLEGVLTTDSSELREGVRKLIGQVRFATTGDLLANVAVFLLTQIMPKHPGTSLLRLAVELAYNLYKESKNEA